MLHFLKSLQTIIVIHAICLHLRNQSRLDFINLLSNHHCWVFQNSLDKRQHIGDVIRRLTIQFWDRFNKVKTKSLIHCKIILQFYV